jgi:hypothetical protein
VETSFRPTSAQSKLEAGANPAIGSSYASAVKVYNAKSSLVRFENNYIFFFYEKRSILAL